VIHIVKIEFNSNVKLRNMAFSRAKISAVYKKRSPAAPFLAFLFLLVKTPRIITLIDIIKFKNACRTMIAIKRALCRAPTLARFAPLPLRSLSSYSSLVPPPFLVEQWEGWENGKYVLSNSDCEPIQMSDLLTLADDEVRLTSDGWSEATAKASYRTDIAASTRRFAPRPTAARFTPR